MTSTVKVPGRKPISFKAGMSAGAVVKLIRSRCIYEGGSLESEGEEVALTDDELLSVGTTYLFVDFIGGTTEEVSYEVMPLDPREENGTLQTEWWDTDLAERLPCLHINGVPSKSEIADMTKRDATLEPYIQLWMRGHVAKGECGQHCRNDCLFLILMKLSGLSSWSRDNHEDSTKGQTRSDATLYFNGVPIVNIEEKETDVEGSVSDLKEKFCWIPHWAMLPFVVGFAMSVTELRVFCFSPMMSDYWATEPVISMELTSSESRLRCLKYVVNIARVIKFYIASNMVVTPPFPFDEWKDRASKSVRMFGRYVENKYAGKDAKYEEMKNLYCEIERLQIPFVEHLYDDDPCDDARNIIRLQPVGVQRSPATIEDLRTAIKCILRFLRQFHDAGYMHCDIRWPNIVQVYEEWFVIDCTEFIRRDAEPAKLLAKSNSIKSKYVLDLQKPWSPRHDYYQVGLLIRNAPGIKIAGTDLKELADKLTGKTKGLEELTDSL